MKMKELETRNQTQISEMSNTLAVQSEARVVEMTKLLEAERRSNEKLMKSVDDLGITIDGLKRDNASISRYLSEAREALDLQRAENVSLESHVQDMRKMIEMYMTTLTRVSSVHVGGNVGEGAEEEEWVRRVEESRLREESYRVWGEEQVRLIGEMKVEKEMALKEWEEKVARLDEQLTQLLVRNMELVDRVAELESITVETISIGSMFGPRSSSIHQQ
jgi:hypothetical protein